MPVILHVPEEDAEECMLQDVLETLKIRCKKVEDNFVFLLPTLTDSIVKELDAKGYKLYKESFGIPKDGTNLIYTVEFKYFL